MSDSKKTDKAHPWRDNIEAVTMAIVMAVLLKYFIIEAYKIPTGSMQPTLMGLAYEKNEGVFDRILVDKLSYHFRDPQRFEVAVFRYPLDRSKNFIKRIVGMPGEQLRIHAGDVLVRKDASEEWRPLRRPRPVQRETWKELSLADEWRVDSSAKGWLEQDEGERLICDGPGSASFPRTSDSVRDHYTDGYDEGLIPLVRRRARGSGENRVGDLRIEGEASLEGSVTSLRIELREGDGRYIAELPGPAAPSGARATLRRVDGAGVLVGEELSTEAEFKLSTSETCFGLQNLDDLVELEIDGEVLLSLEVPVATDQRSSVTLRLSGGGAEFDELEVMRDIYYTSERATTSVFEIPEGHYVMLGDNTQDSADSREWQLAGRQLVSGDDAGVVLRGNLRGSENPRVVTGGPDGTEIFFTDQYGERHHFLSEESQPLPPIRTPFVPRELITGRALLVFWPLKPSLGVYRLQWIH